MGMLFIVGNFWIDPKSVGVFVDRIIEAVYEIGHVPAVVIIDVKTQVLSPERSESVETENYVCIDHYPAPSIRERVLIIKNRFCRFPFDYGILKDMYAGTGP